MWNDLWAAVALMMVLEGILPFLSPRTMRQVLLTAAQMDDRSLRLTGIVSMFVGLGLLYWVH